MATWWKAILSPSLSLSEHAEHLSEDLKLRRASKILNQRQTRELANIFGCSLSCDT